MRVKGKIVQWDDTKGFGYVQPMLKGERVFLHITAIQQRTRRPVLGEVITYSVSKDTTGRKQATNVTYAGEKLRPKAAKKSAIFPLAVVTIFFSALLIASWFETIPFYVLPVYLGMSLLTLLMYWQDKRQAQQGGWRVSEARLQILALLGGWPGALLAQNYLRHKSQKREFLLVFWLSVIFNIVLLTQLKHLSTLNLGMFYGI